MNTPSTTTSPVGHTCAREHVFVGRERQPLGRQGAHEIVVHEHEGMQLVAHVLDARKHAIAAYLDTPSMEHSQTKDPNYKLDTNRQQYKRVMQQYQFIG